MKTTNRYGGRGGNDFGGRQLRTTACELIDRAGQTAARRAIFMAAEKPSATEQARCAATVLTSKACSSVATKLESTRRQRHAPAPQFPIVTGATARRATRRG
jgi:hypothetical protein